MSIRSALLLAIFAALMPLILIKPHVGVLAWSWFAYMNPHRLTFGFTYGFGFAQIIAGLTILGWLISKEPKMFPVNVLSVLLGLLTFWICVTTVFSLTGAYSYDKFYITIKILFFTFVTLALIHTRDRINQLIWVIVLSLGFYGAKGGVFAVITQGEHLVWGPPGSFIADNNTLALALVVTLPLMGYLFFIEERRYLKLAILGLIGLTVFSVVASYSRGSYLGLAAAGGIFWLRSQYRMSALALAAVGVVVVGIAFSEKIVEEIKSIEDYQADASSMSRLVMWRYGYEVAVANPLTGGGFNIFHYEPLYSSFGLKPCASDQAVVSGEEGWCKGGHFGTNAHSIYFEVLGEHGFAGFFIFISILVGTLFVGQRIIGKVKVRPDMKWARTLAEMLQLSVIAYAVAGAFYNLAFFDLFYHIVALMCILQAAVSRELAGETDPDRFIHPLHRSRPRPAPPGNSLPGPVPGPVAAVSPAVQAWPRTRSPATTARPAGSAPPPGRPALPPGRGRETRRGGEPDPH